MKKKKQSKVLIVLTVIAVVVMLAYTVYVNYYRTPVETDTCYDIEALAIPKNNGNTVEHTGYTLLYSEENEQPVWVAYVITPEEVNSTSVTRKDNFREDPAISTGSASLADYKGSGYDRGHMAPFADLSWSEESGSDSFYMSNMSPQVSSLNRGKWASLEALVRTYAKDQPICVVTGPVLTDGPYLTIGENKVSVPNYYFKAILNPEKQQAIGFVLPNASCSEDLSYYAVTIDYIEELTGLDLFYLLEDTLENSIESTADYYLW